MLTTKYIFTALSENGYASTAYKMAANPILYRDKSKIIVKTKRNAKLVLGKDIVELKIGETEIKL